MSDTIVDNRLGRVMSGDTHRFTYGVRATTYHPAGFGSFIKAQADSRTVIALICRMTVDDDPLTRQLVQADRITTQVLRDQRENRKVPLECTAINLGYIYENRIYHALPPHPPISLEPVFACTADETIAFSQKFTFLRTIIKTTPPSVQYKFLIDAGRVLAKLLASDQQRLDHVLQAISPNTRNQVSNP
jgi:hypothetical protein